jgi:hypothetical protein
MSYISIRPMYDKTYDKRCMTMRRKRRIRLVEDFQPRSIDINELHYARLLGERTVTVRSIELHHRWCSPASKPIATPSA